METKERFEKVAILISKLDEHKISGTIRFTDMDEKMSLKTIYQSLYGNIQVDLSCTNCILHYLNMLQAWYEREWPMYLKTLVIEVIADVEDNKVEEIITPTVPVIKPKGKRR